MGESRVPYRPLLEAGSRCRYQGSGDRLGNVELGALLGVGERCLVQEARDTRSGRELVIKYLRPERAAQPTLATRFAAAGRALLGLEHPATARVFGVGTEPVPFRLVDRVEGETLAARLERSGPLTTQAASRVVSSLAEALAEAHSRGLLFGELTPARIFLGAGDDAVKLSWSTRVNVGARPERDGTADLEALAEVHAAMRAGKGPIAEQAWAALTRRSTELGELLHIGGATLRRIGHLDVLTDSAAMAAMAFRIEGESDKRRSRQQRSYGPAHQKIEDAGLHQVGGRASLTVRGITPGRDLLMISRIVQLDALAAHELWVNGGRADSRGALKSRKNAWYNMLYVVPGALLHSDEAMLELRVEPQEFQHYHYWFYQPVSDPSLGSLPPSITSPVSEATVPCKTLAQR